MAREAFYTESPAAPKEGIMNTLTRTQRAFALLAVAGGLVVVALLFLPVHGAGIYDNCGFLWSAIGGGPYPKNSGGSYCRGGSHDRLGLMAGIALVVVGSGVAGVFIFRPSQDRNPDSLPVSGR